MKFIAPPRARLRRGVTMLGMLAIIVVVATFCASILERSAEASRASAMLAWRLQARAAAEGAARVLAGNPGGQAAPLAIGDALVTTEPAQQAEANARSLPLHVDVQRAGTKVPAYSAQFRAVYARGGGSWRLERVEE